LRIYKLFKGGKAANISFNIWEEYELNNFSNEIFKCYSQFMILVNILNII
jgi:hypothetical protein